jgi:hypothetical protein
MSIRFISYPTPFGYQVPNGSPSSTRKTLSRYVLYDINSHTTISGNTSPINLTRKEKNYLTIQKPIHKVTHGLVAGAVGDWSLRLGEWMLKRLD